VIVISSIDKAKDDFKPNAEEYLAQPVDKLVFIAAVQRHVARALYT
jgi:hypothetical protein